MSMYGVNAGVPKTLVRHLVQYEADIAATGAARRAAGHSRYAGQPRAAARQGQRRDRQQTEDLVGPYELHDFYLYYVLRFGFGPAKIFRLAKAFAGVPSTRTRAVQVAAQLLLAVLCPAVQAQLPAGRPQDRQRDPLAARRLADAQRRRAALWLAELEQIPSRMDA